MGAVRLIRTGAPSGGIPNNPDLPAVVLGGAVPAPSAAHVGALYAAHGWGGTWVWTVFAYHHYHPASHEALTCLRGQARIRIGGPAGTDVDIAAGDVLILPAGVGHCRMNGSEDFAVMGAYPAGQENPEICRAGTAPALSVLTRIRATARPGLDPICGQEGPLVEAWGLDGPASSV